MRSILADLHIHTALSPCADKEMTPPAIIKAAKAKGLEIIGICDHNSAENVLPVMEAGMTEGITVIGGIEVQTVEDVHVLTFFPHTDALTYWQEEIQAALPGAQNDEGKFGEQLIVDSSGRIIGKLHILLLAPTSMSIDYLGKRVRELEGIVIPAHVDRPIFSLIRNLGFVPEGLRPDCIEISKNISVKEARNRFPCVAGFSLIQSSDAHRLNEVSGYTCFWMEDPKWDEMLLALKSSGGRYVMPRETAM